MSRNVVTLDPTARTILNKILSLMCAADANRTVEFQQEVTTLQEILTNLTDNSGEERIPNFERVIDAGSIIASPFSFSVMNTGAANGVLLGDTLKPGEILNFDAGAVNNIFAAGSITYDATGTEFIITYITE